MQDLKGKLMNKKKASENYEFPEFARGTFIEHLENGIRQAPVERAKAVRDFWHVITKYFK